MVKNEYAKAYMSDKTRMVVKDNIKEMFDNVKYKRKFNSDSETLKFLCNIEKNLSDKNMIENLAICDDCTKQTPIENLGKFHNKIDPSSNCFGCFVTKYRIKTERNDAKEQKTEHDKTKEQKTEHNEAKEQKTENELGKKQEKFTQILTQEGLRC